MTKFYMDLVEEGGTVHDEDGTDLVDISEARHRAIQTIRSIIAEEAKGGLLRLTGWVEILDEARHHVGVVTFIDAFAVEVSTPKG